MDLFEAAQNNSLEGTPLAEELRPKNFSEMLGQEKFFSTQSSVYQMIQKGRVPSLILWGPPGCGKTTFAQILAQHTSAHFISRNAVDTGAKDLRELGESARQRRLQYHEQTLLFIDEIHRLNKAQQDVLLPFVERGEIILVGATTENPSFEVNSALLSRCQLVVFERLSSPALEKIIFRAFEKNNLKHDEILSQKAFESLLQLANGDARRLLNQLEQIIYSYSQNREDYEWPLNEEILQKILSHAPIYYNRQDAHYDCASAFIKSIRASDADAGLYYLARMIEGGEDPIFIARRLVVLASEDVGNADPQALPLAIAGLQAVQLVGLPEAAINLAQVVTYLATAPKSNRSYAGWKLAQQEVQLSGNLEIPHQIRNAPTKMMKSLGYSEGYKYAHEFEKGYVPLDCLPTKIKDKKFYQPSNLGYEDKIQKFMSWLKATANKTNN